MSNNQANENELFELFKDNKSTDNIISEFEDIETQLGRFQKENAPLHLKNTILANLEKPRHMTFYQFLPFAAAVFIVLLSGILYFKTSNAPQQVSLEKINIIKNELTDVSDIIEKELGANSFKKQKYYALYFSSSLCKPCVDLLTELDTFYLEKKAKNPDFEIIYIEIDKHIHNVNKPTELHIKKIDYNQLHDKSFFKKYNEGHGPSFVVIDNKGKVITKHKKNVQRNSFNNVLTSFSDLLAKS